MQPAVVVVGAGLAGLAAACDLAERGFAVTVVEKGRVLGGRAASFARSADEEPLDTGQHVFMKCCTAYLGLLRRLGVEGLLLAQERLHLPVFTVPAGWAVLEASRLPAPLHLLPSFARYRHLDAGDQLRVLRALARIRRTDRHAPELDREPFGDWLRRHSQSERAVRHFWDLIVLPTLNAPCDEASARLGLMVFQVGILGTRDGADIGYALVPLSDLLMPAAADFLIRRGARLLCGARALQLELADPSTGPDAQMPPAGAQLSPGDTHRPLVAGVRLADGNLLRADACVLAVPHHAVAGLLPPALRFDAFFTRAGQLGSSPIADVHLWYDRVVTEPGFTFGAYLRDHPRFVFSRTRMLGAVIPGDMRASDGGDASFARPRAGQTRPPAAGEHLSISLSAANAYMDMPQARLVDAFHRELAEVFPRIRAARLVRGTVRKQRHATFAPSPGCETLRPPQRTPVPNLFLAGDWTRTGWPATMEGAVRSGQAAAAEVERWWGANRGGETTR